MKLTILSFLSLASFVVLAACSGTSTGVGTAPAPGPTGATSPTEPSDPGNPADPGGNPADPGGDPADPGTSSPASPGDLVVFTSKATFNGNLGGTAGADAKCTTYANAAGLPGSFRAWLSTATVDAITRVPEGGPWRLRDPQGGLASDTVFADKKAWAGYPNRAINRDEFGNPVLNASVWTASELGGFKVGCACVNWTSSDYYGCSGSSAETGGVFGNSTKGYGEESWTNSGAARSCEQRLSLICYQI